MRRRPVFFSTQQRPDRAMKFAHPALNRAREGLHDGVCVARRGQQGEPVRALRALQVAQDDAGRTVQHQRGRDHADAQAQRHHLQGIAEATRLVADARAETGIDAQRDEAVEVGRWLQPAEADEILLCGELQRQRSRSGGERMRCIDGETVGVRHLGQYLRARGQFEWAFDRGIDEPMVQCLQELDADHFPGLQRNALRRIPRRVDQHGKDRMRGRRDVPDAHRLASVHADLLDERAARSEWSRMA